MDVASDSGDGGIAMIGYFQIPVGRTDRSLRPAPAWLRGMVGAGDAVLSWADWIDGTADRWPVFFGLLIAVWFTLLDWCSPGGSFFAGLLVGAILSPFLGLLLSLLMIPLLRMMALLGALLHLASECLAGWGKWQLPDEYERLRQTNKSANLIEIDTSPPQGLIPERKKRHGGFLAGLVIGWTIGVWWDE